jgi:hypothetical protein
MRLAVWLLVPIDNFDRFNNPRLAGPPLEFLGWIPDSGQRQAAGLGHVAIADKVLRVKRKLAQLRGTNY